MEDIDDRSGVFLGLGCLMFDGIGFVKKMGREIQSNKPFLEQEREYFCFNLAPYLSQCVW